MTTQEWYDLGLNPCFAAYKQRELGQFFFFFLCCSCLNYKRMILIAPTLQSYDDCIFSPFEVSRILFVVQSLSHVRFFVTLMDCSTPGSAVLHYLPGFAEIHVH